MLYQLSDPPDYYICFRTDSLVEKVMEIRLARGVLWKVRDIVSNKEGVVAEYRLLPVTKATIHKKKEGGMLSPGDICKLNPPTSKTWTGFRTKNLVEVVGFPIKLSGGFVCKVRDIITREGGMVGTHRLVYQKSTEEKLSEFL